MIQSRSELWQLLTTLPEGDAAEIGVAEGRFSLEMLTWPVWFPRVYMVDRWQQVEWEQGAGGHPQSWHDANLADAQVKVAEHAARAIFLRGDSVEMASLVPDGSLVFCYVDCEHSFEGVRDDIDAWYPKLMSGGVMAFHDFNEEYHGVKKAVVEFCERWRFELVMIPEKRVEDAGAYFRK